MKITTFDEFAKEEIEEERWLIKPIIPASGIILLHGATDAGKSALLFTLTDAISCGEKLLGLETTQANVLYVNLDMPQSGLQVRLKGAVKKPKGFLIPYLPPLNIINEGFLGSTEYEWIQKVVEAHSIKLVIFDTLSDLVQGKFSDDEVALGTYRVLRAWLPGVAIIVTHHDRKLWRNAEGQGAPDDEDALGSQFWRSKAQSTLHLYKVNDVVRELVHTKSHSGEKLPNPIRLTLEDSAMRVEVWTRTRSSESRMKFSQAAERAKANGHGPQWNGMSEEERVDAMAEASGVNVRTVWRWKKSMEEV